MQIVKNVFIQAGVKQVSTKRTLFLQFLLLHVHLYLINCYQYLFFTVIIIRSRSLSTCFFSRVYRCSQLCIILVFPTMIKIFFRNHLQYLASYWPVLHNMRYAIRKYFLISRARRRCIIIIIVTNKIRWWTQRAETMVRNVRSFYNYSFGYSRKPAV